MLLAIKLWEWCNPGTTRIRADRFNQGRGCLADFFMRPPTLKAGNFAALWPTDAILIVWKDLSPTSKYISISRGWQHFMGRFCSLKKTSFQYYLSSKGAISNRYSCMRQPTCLSTTWHTVLHQFQMPHEIVGSNLFWGKTLDLNTSFGVTSQPIYP